MKPEEKIVAEVDLTPILKGRKGQVAIFAQVNEDDGSVRYVPLLIVGMKNTKTGEKI